MRAVPTLKDRHRAATPAVGPLGAAGSGIAQTGRRAPQRHLAALTVVLAGFTGGTPGLAQFDSGSAPPVEIVGKVLDMAVERCGLALSDPAGFMARLAQWPDLSGLNSADGRVLLLGGTATMAGERFVYAGEDDMPYSGLLRTEVEMFAVEAGMMVSCSVSTEWMDDDGSQPDAAARRIDGWFREALAQRLPAATLAGSVDLRHPDSRIAYDYLGYDNDAPRPTYVLGGWSQTATSGLLVTIMPESIDIYSFGVVPQT